MPSFAPKSLACYATMHPDLQRVADEAIKLVDFSIICGHRDQATQDMAFNGGTSKAKWPHSPHNAVPSRAMDLIPSPFTTWADEKQFYYLAGVITAIAAQLGVKIRWGGTFASIKDLDHFELA